MKQIRKLLVLSTADLQLLVEAGLLVVLVRLGLWVLPFRKLKAFTEHMPLDARKENIDWEFAGKIAWAVRVTSRLIFKASCLTQAVATQILLTRRGFSSDLQIGVARNEAGKFEAHAWVESRGRVVIGELQDLVRYVPLPMFKKL